MRRGAVVLALLLPALGSAPAMADEQPVTATVPFAAESWWSASALATGGLLGALGNGTPVDIYPAGTLHVAVTAGQEIARTYLTPQTSLPEGATLVDATLTVPLDTTTALDGSISPDQARVWVCTTTQSVVSGEGLVGAPPVVDCSTHVALDYVAGTIPALTGDLAPLLPALARQDVSLALVPASDVATTDLWHVVFSSDSRDAPPTPPPTLTVAYTPAAAPEPSPSSAAPTSAAAPSTGTSIPVVVPSPPTVAVPPPVSVGGALPVTPSEGSPAPAPVVAAPPATVTTPVAPVASVIPSYGFAYPGVLLLPLVMLVVLWAVGRQLTGPIRTSQRRLR